MCRRAGKLTLGFDATKEAAEEKQAYVVCIASDLSPKTLKEVGFFCMPSKVYRENEIPILRLPASMDQLWSALGRRTGVLGVCDKGFADRLTEILKEWMAKT